MQQELLTEGYKKALPKRLYAFKNDENIPSLIVKEIDTFYLLNKSWEKNNYFNWTKTRTEWLFSGLFFFLFVSIFLF